MSIWYSMARCIFPSPACRRYRRGPRASARPGRNYRSPGGTPGITKLTNEKDFAFCERLSREAGVALIPLSAFFKSGTPDTFVRFAFCKQQALIEQSLDRLEKYFAKP